METGYKNTFIYALIEEGCDIIKYIGKSNHPKRRVQQHICDSINRKTPKDYWIQSVLNRSKKIDFIILEEVKYKHWPEREVYWIDKYKEQIKNCCEGGRGGRPVKYSMSYEDAKKWIKDNFNEINSQTNWFKNINNLPSFISPYPADTYAHRGWVSWGDWLNTNKISDKELSKKYVTYEESKVYIKKLKLNSKKDWKNFSKSIDFPTHIPRKPDRFYKTRGWIDWYDFLGKTKITYLPFIDARKQCRKLKIKSSTEWRKQKKEGKFSNLPSSPEKVYKNSGWVNWYDWLGK